MIDAGDRALAIRCRRCGARPWRPCVVTAENPLRLYGVHTERYNDGNR